MMTLLTGGVLLTGSLRGQGTWAAEAVEAAPTIRTNGVHMDFRGAPLDQVLDYLSEAAGFIVNKQTEVHGTVEIWSKEPVTRDEAVQLLNSALKKNGYTAVRSGKILTIVSLENAKSSDLEVVHGGDPESVVKSDEVVTQVIPVRFANANQLVNNLQPLLPTSATLSPNESANSLVLVATRTEIKRMLNIIRALDNSLARATSIKVLPLRYADAKQLATAVQQLFATQATVQNSSTAPGFGPQMFNFPGGPPGTPGAFGPPNGQSLTTASSSGTANVAGSKVVAVADETSNSLIISAAEDILSGLVDMVGKIDRPVSAITEVRAFRLHNADPTELAEHIAELFPDNTRSSSQNQTPGVFSDGQTPGGPPGFFGPPGGNNDDSQVAASSRAAKAGRVLAVPDPRTSSLLVSASATLMPQIARLLEKLDSSGAGKETLAVFDLSNADPNQVRQILEDLFNRNLTARNSAQSRSQNNNSDPLLSRQTQQQQTGNNSGNSGFGAGRSPGGASGGFGSSGSP